MSQLVSVTVGGNSRTEFVYDGMNRLRISIDYVWNAQTNSWGPPVEKRRIYDGMDVVQERNTYNQVTASVTRAGNIGGILARSTAQSGTSYFAYDPQGNVTTLTDSSGAVVGSYTYDAWGNVLASSGARAGENPYRFSTKEALGGLYSFGFRFYNPGTGRWINRDPIREAGGVNLYAMVGNNPINAVDAYGLARVELRFRQVVASGNHAFILVWDTDAGGNKVGTPWFFGGYNVSRSGVGDGLLHTDYGPYVNRPGNNLDRDYWYQPGHPSYRGSRCVVSDNKPASDYIKRFKQVADKIENSKIRYRFYGTNSNAIARTIIEWGLGVELGRPGYPGSVDGTMGRWGSQTPGWDRSLLGNGLLD